jgi:Gpi18-like mannosyltransferase
VLIKIKLTWFLFDVLLVYFTYRIVALRWAGWRIPTLAALVMAFLPTVVINSSFYGQCDAIWGAFALGGLYQLLRGRQWWGVALFTVALAFKPQAIFIFPLLALLALAGLLRWRTLLAVPLVYLVLDLPAIFAGRNPVELLTLYSPARQAIHVPALTSNAASMYAFMPVTTRLDTLKTLGYVFAAIFVVGVLYTLIASRVRLSPERIVTAAALFVILVPFLLPGMHERYFFLADVLTVVLAFYRPRLWFVPLIVQAASLLSYLPFLFWDTPHGPLVGLKILATMMLAALLITGYALLHDLRSSQETETITDEDVQVTEKELVHA